MSQRAVLCFLCVLGVFLKGQTAPIESQQTVMAAIGDSACLTCQLMQSKDVEQVKWLKISPEGKEKMASKHKIYGQKVNPDFEAKMEFKYGGLMNCSMTIKNWTDQDEGCYRCLFITADGAFNATICLQRSGLREPFLRVTISTSSEEVLCSATGPPAPTVTPTVPHHNSTSVTNTTTAAPADGLDVESGSNVWIIVGVVVGLCVAAAAVAFIVFYKYKHQNRQNPQENTPGNPESVSMIPMDSENNNDTHELQNTSIEEQTTSADINMQSIKTASSQNHLEEENNSSSVPNSIHSAQNTFNEARERTTDTDDWKKDTNGFHQKSSKEKNVPVPHDNPQA